MKEKIEKRLDFLIPTPKKVDRIDGYCELPGSIFSCCEEFFDSCDTFCTCIKKIFGTSILHTKEGIELRFDKSISKAGYTVDTRNGVVLSASSKEGISYALATLLQMLVKAEERLWVAKAYIQDYPDRDYRALMVDLAREWHTAEKVLKYIDVCFMLKIRYLHLHFIDDQRYTLPSKVLPDVTKYNNHYTFEEIEEFRTYANARGVLLIPEFEVPGHAAMLVKTYPEIFALHTDDSNNSKLVTEAGAVVTAKNIICAGSKKANDAIFALLEEICEMFPESPYIHIGGDEANIRAWNGCSECGSYMKEHNLEDVYELYSEFVGRVAQMVIDFGRTPIVWEGFPNKGVQHIPKETIVTAWESHYQLPNELLDNGFQVINASWQPLYIVPSYKTRWGVNEIIDWNIYNWQHWWSESAASCQHINVEPTDKVLGAQICAWECTYEEAVGRVLECLSTLSERTWNVETLHTADAFILRMNVTLHRVARLIG